MTNDHSGHGCLWTQLQLDSSPGSPSQCSSPGSSSSGQGSAGGKQTAVSRTENQQDVEEVLGHHCRLFKVFIETGSSADALLGGVAS